MAVTIAYERIAADLHAIWGDMAFAMLRKRLRDVHAELATLTRDDLVKIVQLLRERTLPAVIGEEGAEAKATQYLAWVDDAA